MAWVPFVAAADIHGDQQDPNVVRAFHKFCKDWKPKHRIAAGDVWDFRALRRKASEDEKRESLLLDYQKGSEFIDEFQPTVFLEGNHDARLRYLRDLHKGPASDLAAKCLNEINTKFGKIKCQQYPYHKVNGVYRLGNLKVIHGFFCGVTAARRSAQVYGSVLVFHGHGIQEASIEGIENRIGRMCGCLCKLDMDYVETSMPSLMWRHGWAYGVVNDKTGRYQVWQAECIDGIWLLPTGFKEL